VGRVSTGPVVGGVDYNPPECCQAPVTLAELVAMYVVLCELAFVAWLVVCLVKWGRR
jgi:hypothetical protein